MVHQYKNVL